MARTVIVSIGTRGDVVPYAALGSALAGAGDRVAIATHPRLRRHVDGAELGAASLTVDRKDVLVVGDEPHAELFPRVAAVVHHGGAGTTAAALRAGTRR